MRQHPKCSLNVIRKMGNARKRRQQGKQQLNEEPMCTKSEMDKTWLKDLPTNSVHVDEMNLDESDTNEHFLKIICRS